MIRYQRGALCCTLLQPRRTGEVFRLSLKHVNNAEKVVDRETKEVVLWQYRYESINYVMLHVFSSCQPQLSLFTVRSIYYMFFKYYISTLLPPSQRVKKGENYTSHQQKLSTSWPHFSQNSPPLLNPPPPHLSSRIPHS